MDHDRLREAAWKTYYDTYFQELMSQALCARYEAVDIVSAIIVAVTASGSTIAGLALWSTGAGKPLWAVISGASAVVALIHGALRVTDRAQRWAETRRALAELRVQLETYWLNLHMGRFDEQGFDRLRERFAKLIGDAPGDILSTTALRARVQGELNDVLNRKGEIR